MSKLLNTIKRWQLTKATVAAQRQQLGEYVSYKRENIKEIKFNTPKLKYNKIQTMKLMNYYRKVLKQDKCSGKIK